MIDMLRNGTRDRQQGTGGIQPAQCRRVDDGIFSHFLMTQPGVGARY